MNPLLRTILVYLTAIIAYLIAFPFIIVHGLLAKDRSESFLLATRVWCRWVLKAAGITITTHGRQHIPQTPVVFVANHASYLDIPILAITLPFRVRFVARDNLFRAPFLGWIMRHSAHIPIERKGSKKSLKVLLETAHKVKQGLSVLIFPEGTRSSDGTIGTFKKGSLLIASRAKATIVPIAIKGSHQIMPRHSFFIRPTTVTVTIGEPINYFSAEKTESPDETELLQKLRDQIKAMMG